MFTIVLEFAPLLIPLLVFTAALPWKRPFIVAQWLNGMGFVVTALGALPLDRLGFEAPGLLSALPGWSIAVTLLVTFLGWVLVRFSDHYLAGEPGRDTYVSSLQLTLGAVLLVVLADHLAVVIVGWTAISLGLHRLLVFYPNRPQAALAAHKKFLLARTAELILLGAGGLLYLEYNTWQLSELRQLAAATEPGLFGQSAAVLLAFVALIKCAQLPVHGWLIQVVEAPTPVSALLHAGVINLGGVLIIMFAPLFDQVAAARWVLLMVAGPTLVIAALMMANSTSIKPKLAWSTAAQMGLMLVECGLGLYALALLHLVAHSCYKAYVFLSSGTAVHRATLARQYPGEVTSRRGFWLAGSLAAVITLTVAFTESATPTVAPWLIMGLLLTLVLGEFWQTKRSFGVVLGIMLALLLLAIYSLQAFISAAVVATPSAPTSALQELWVDGLLIALTVIAARYLTPTRSSVPSLAMRLLMQRIHWLDAWVTRSTLKIWPVDLLKLQNSHDKPAFVVTKTAAAPQNRQIIQTQEAH